MAQRKDARTPPGDVDGADQRGGGWRAQTEGIGCKSGGGGEGRLAETADQPPSPLLSFSLQERGCGPLTRPSQRLTQRLTWQPAGGAVAGPTENSLSLKATQSGGRGAALSLAPVPPQVPGRGRAVGADWPQGTVGLGVGHTPTPSLWAAPPPTEGPDHPRRTEASPGGAGMGFRKGGRERTGLRPLFRWRKELLKGKGGGAERGQWAQRGNVEGAPSE